jgi:hypothetical protein
MMKRKLSILSIGIAAVASLTAGHTAVRLHRLLRVGSGFQRPEQDARRAFQEVQPAGIELL